MNDSFVSIVTDPADYTKVQVRARKVQDLVELFKDFCSQNPQIDFTQLMEDMEHTPSRDYQYRICMHRDAIAAVIAYRVRNIYYHNFKDSIDDYTRSKVCGNVWADLYELDTPKRSSWFTTDGRSKKEVKEPRVLKDKNFK